MLSTFANGEIYARYGESIRGADVFILQTHSDPINDRLMEQLIMIDAAKRASAKRITAVVPVLRLLAPGQEDRGPRADHRPARRRHAHGGRRRPRRHRRPAQGQIQGFFDFPVDHLTALPLLVELPARASIDGDDVRSSRPTPAACKRAQRFANHLTAADLAFIDKRRPKGTHNVAAALEVVGEVAGRTCVLVDDMIDTGGTIVARRRAARRSGGADVYRRGHPRPALRTRPSTG